VFFGSTGKVADLLPMMVKHKNEKYLIPMSNVHDDSVHEMLEAKKLNHTECVMYRTVSNDFTEEEAAAFDYDMCVFFSPSGISAFQKTFGDSKNKDVVVATFGPSTSRAAHEAGLKVVIEAPSAKYPSMTGALKAYLESINS
jgi:uroporphyrinogen-III synthase